MGKVQGTSLQLRKTEIILKPLINKPKYMI